MVDKKGVSYQAPGQSLSLEGVFLTHLLSYLDRLQDCWMGGEENRGEGLNTTRFEYQLLFLIRLLPDRKRQDEILESWLVRKGDEKYREMGLDEEKIVAFAGMEAVSELMAFISRTFDLVHTDITGPATNKQFLKAEVEIGDMPVELVASLPVQEAAPP